MLSKPIVRPNQHECGYIRGWKYQCEMVHEKGGTFIGYGSTPRDAWESMWLTYEMWCDPELHK
jgi:hypothetical protein